MGIDNFFSSINQNDEFNKLKIIYDYHDKISTDYLYIDFNSFVHTLTSHIDEQINYILYSIILEINDNDINNIDNIDNILNTPITLKYDEKLKEISNFLNFKMETLTLKDFLNYFNDVFIEKKAIEYIGERLHWFCDNYITDDLKMIYIAIDGVPSMGKIIEQKKRKYNSYIMSKLKFKLFEKHKQTFPLKRVLYEKIKGMGGKTKNISLYTIIDKLKETLNSTTIINSYKHFTNLKQIIFSDHNVYGEGEKKIIEHILSEKKEGNYTIYSPDSDMIMLGMMGSNMIENTQMKIVRANIVELNKTNCNIIDINKLSDSIYEYVCKKMKNVKLEKENVINDIVFLFTLFGNDFIPKIESLDVKHDFETLLNYYCIYMFKMLNFQPRKKFKYLVFKEFNKVYKISYENFKGIISLFASNEDQLLYESYTAYQHKNYYYLKTLLGCNKLVNKLFDYTTKANNVIKCRKNIEHYGYVKDRYSNDDNFMRVFLLIECYNHVFVLKYILLNTFEDIDEKQLDMMDKNKLIELFNHKIPNGMEKTLLVFDKKKISDLFSKILIEILEDRINIKYGAKLVPYQTNFSTDSLYKTQKIRSNLQKNMIHPKMEVSEYDVNAWKFEKKIGEFTRKLNSNNYDLGKVEIYVNNSLYYVYKSPLIDSVCEYYNTFFGLDNQKITNKVGKQTAIIDNIDELVKEYIGGFFWVFDNYFNKNNYDYNKTNISKYMYPYNRTPLLYQINSVISKYNNDDFHTIYLNVIKNNISIDKFINKVEHHIYITPKHILHNIPNRYQKMIKEHDDIFPDLDDIVEKIWNDDNNKEVIDSQRISHLSKCNFPTIKFIKFDDYIEKINKIRTTDDIPTIIHQTTINLS